MNSEEKKTCLEPKPESEPKPLVDNDNNSEIYDSVSENETEYDKDILQELKENISRNSIAIADIGHNISKDESVISEYTTETRKTDTDNKTDENQNKKKKKKKKNIYPRYVYADLFDDDIDEDDNEWTNLKRYRFQKCLWKLKYNRIVSTFYLDNLRRREQRWSWMIIVISTLTSGLTVANNVEDEPIDNYNTYVNLFLTVSSMSTSLIAAWIKKQMFIEKINETDKYLLNINSLCEELEVQFSLLNHDRTSYADFKKKFIPEITKFLTTNPMIPPDEWKSCIREITLKYPELVDPDNTEDNKLWPWYGDLVFEIDDNKFEHHTRKPTTFMEHFKQTNTDKLRSSCCGKRQINGVY